jgi:hypothetical protein
VVRRHRLVPGPDHEPQHSVDRVTFLQETGQIMDANLSWSVFRDRLHNFQLLVLI